MEAGRSLTFEERLPQSARSKQESMRQSRCIFAPSCRTLHHPRYDHQTLSHELLQLQEQLTSLHPVEPDMMQSQTGVALKPYIWIPRVGDIPSSLDGITTCSKNGCVLTG
jgi:hypothetical protein